VNVRRKRRALVVLALLALASCGGGDAPPAPLAAGPVELVLADRVLFVGSFHPVEVKIDPASGLTMDDLAFEIPAGPLAGEISLSRERDNTDPRQVMLLVGPRPGKYDLRVLRKTKGEELDRLSYEVTTSWQDPADGPGVSFTGAVEEPAVGSAWGGGPSTPQNLDVMPQSGTWRVAIVLVDTDTVRYTGAEAAAVRAKYLDAAVNGVTGTDGVTRSVARWYSEVSYGAFTISARAFGPYPLAGPLTDYIAWNDPRPYAWNGNVQPGFWRACVAAADDEIDYAQFDSVVFVSRSDDRDPLDVCRAWALGSVGTGRFNTGEGSVRFGVISMPSDYERVSSRGVLPTLAHELGHNLGLDDQYAPDVPMPGTVSDSRNLDTWELMDAQGGLPHFAAAHRMMLGWLDASWIRGFDFATSPGPIDETVRLQAIESGAPGTGNASVIEVRIADGLNYYFEFRNPQSGHIGDRELPTPAAVLGTDVATNYSWARPARPLLLLLANDGDGDGSVLQVGADYEEVDLSDATFPADFQVEVVGIAGDLADVRVRYGASTRPDPSIRPWPAGPGRRWQSPDIEVRNARSDADPALINLPWAENPNTVVARIRNRGTVPATAVTANFYVKDYTLGAATETLLGSDTRDIGVDATVEFSTSWTPPAVGHFCIVVRIPPHGTLGGAELTDTNNVAQSNYNQFVSDTASPAVREVTHVVVRNPLSVTTRVWLVGGQSNPMFRTYIEHAWVLLAPDETRRVKLMFEYAGHAPRLPPPVPQPTDGQPLPSPNTVTVRAFIEDPLAAPFSALTALDGIQARVVTGRRTSLEMQVDGAVVTGRVTTVDDGKGVDAGGRVVLSHETPTTKGRTGHQWFDVLGDGTFVFQVPPDWTRVHATYLPLLPGLAESDASVVR